MITIPQSYLIIFVDESQSGTGAASAVIFTISAKRTHQRSTRNQFNTVKVFT